MVLFSYPRSWNVGQPPLLGLLFHTPVECECRPLSSAVRDGQHVDVGIMPSKSAPLARSSLRTTFIGPRVSDRWSSVRMMMMFGRPSRVAFAVSFFRVRP